MKTWKIGLVGTGWWSEKHLKAWKAIPGVKIEALCDHNISKMMQKAEQFDVPKERLYSTIDRMLAEADIDIVDIVTGPKTHCELVRKAAAAGKHILCQKPFAPTLVEAESMVQAARRAGVRLMVTENWRWLQPFQIIKRVLDDGELGQVKTVRYVHIDYYTPRMSPNEPLPQPFFREMPRLLFYEMGVHWFDTWRYLFGTPKRLYAEISRISPYIAGEDTGIVTLGHDGFYGYLDASWATRQKLEQPLGKEVGPMHVEHLLIDGELGTLKYATSGKITIVNKEGTAERTVAASTALDHEDSHYRLQSHYIHCLNTGQRFQTSGEDNLVTLRMALGVYESASKHKVIAIGKEGSGDD